LIRVHLCLSRWIGYLRVVSDGAGVIPPGTAL
jgi:hypothetical protein